MTDLSVRTAPLNWSAITPDGQNADSPDKIRQAAQQFEAVLIGEMMKTTREAGGGGWLGTGEDEAGSTMSELAEQQLAQLMAAQGGFGLATLAEQGLTRQSQPQRLSVETSSPNS